MILGITGGIGSGKSTVSKLFEILGYAVFNSDDVAKQVYFIPSLKEKVVALLGSEAYVDDHRLNRAYISKLVFSNTDLLHRLNAIIHPAVKEQMAQFVAQHQGQNIIKESALLFEAKLEKEVDKIVVVSSPEELVLQRVIKRDGMSREDVLKRIHSQLPQREKEKMAHFVIHNDEQQLLIPQVLAIHEQL